MSAMLEGLDEELEKLRSRQEIVEATLDESNLYADAVKVAQAANLPSADDDVTTRLALVAQTLQGVPPAAESSGAEVDTQLDDVTMSL